MKRKLLKLVKIKKPLLKIKEEMYQNNNNITIEERLLSINQDLAYFGYLLSNVSMNLSYYLDSFIYESDKNRLIDKEDTHKWVIKNMIEMKSEISRLSHMISQNNLIDKNCLHEQIAISKLKNQEVGSIRCHNNKCQHWIKSHKSGICKENNPKLSTDGTCITMELKE